MNIEIASAARIQQISKSLQSLVTTHRLIHAIIIKQAILNERYIASDPSIKKLLVQEST
jgi:hypothetical protein